MRSSYVRTQQHKVIQIHLSEANMSVTDAMTIQEIGEELEELANEGFLTSWEEDYVLAIAGDAGDEGEKFWNSLGQETVEKLRDIHRNTVCEE